ncbi:MAG: tripartite tricarboxylate transporter substrate binding protein [Clostridiales bacterium]|nr:tripartite tricarboxylate transporter substrate binding protein [Clostridiales bacterium]
MKKVSLLLALVMLMSVFSLSALAAEDYPSRTVEATVQWNAGGGADLVFRALANVFPKYANGQTMVIKNIGGASGVTGSTEFLSAKPDGYQVMHWSNAHVSKSHMSNVPYENLETYKLVAQVVESANYLLVPADSKYVTIEDFIADVLANPGMISVANAGIGGGNHIASLLLEKAIGGEFNHISYDGGVQEVTGLISGEVDAAMCNTPEGMANVEAGQIRILISLASKPFKDFPEVPIAIESGVEALKDVIVEQWRGVCVPAGTDDAIIAKLAAILEQCAADEEFVAALDELGAVARYRNTEEFIAFNASEDARLGGLIKELGIGDRYGAK